MRIYIDTIPHKEQRYDTVGDYYFDQLFEEDVISVSDMKNTDYEFLVAIHELTEMYLCKKRGISEKSITAFDKKFEKKNKKNNLEPGDDPKAPYRNEHCIATGIERTVAGVLGVCWKDYEKAMDKLKYGK